MKLVQQTSFNECGVCVANMLVNYFQKKNLAKSEILQQVHLSTEGISILELEEVCEKYGIILESFECEWTEIWENASNNPVVLLLSRFNALHFVLVLKDKKEWVVYDPIGKTYTLDTSQPLSDWTRIAIFCSYPKYYPKPFSLQNGLLTYLTNSWNWLFLFTNLLEFLIGLGTSYLTAKLFNLNGTTILVTTMWKVSFIYLTLVAIHLLFGWLHYWLKRWYFYRIYKVSMFLFLETLNNKRFDFYQSNDSFKLMQYYAYFQKVLSFYTFFLVDLFSQSLTALFCLLFLILINPWNAILVICLTLGLMIIQFNIYRYNKQTLNQMIQKPLQIQQSWQNFSAFKRFNHEVQLSKQLKEQISKQIIDLYQFDLQINFKKHIFVLGQEAIQTLATLFVFLISWSYIHQISSIVLSISLFQLFIKNADGILKFIQEYLFVKPLYKLLKEAIYTNVIDSEKQGKLVGEITELTYQNVSFRHNLAIYIDDLSQHPLCQSLLNQVNKSNYEIMVNQNLLKDFNPEAWFKTLVYLDFDHLTANDMQIWFVSNDQELDWNNKSQIKVAIIQQLSKSMQNKLIILNHFFKEYDETFANQVNEFITNLNESNYLIVNFQDDRWAKLYDNFL